MIASKNHTAQPASLPAGTLRIPEPTVIELVSSRGAIDQAVAELHAAKDIWAQRDLAGKAAILDELQHDLALVGTQWANASLQAKQVPAGGFAEGEEWVIYGGVLRLVRLLRQSLLDIQTHGRPMLPGRPATLASGQTSVPTFPTSSLEKMLLAGMRAETWLEPEIGAEELFVLPGSPLQDRQPVGRVALVLGAGNISAVQCGDLLHKLFVDGQVVALKTNPVNAYLGPILEQAFRALIQRGFLRILYGGADVGAYLCDHPLIDTVHLTGSDKTFESIVFGSGEEGQKRKAEHRPRLTKPITAELGAVNPVIVVPGSWSANDIKRGALMLASWLYSNAGFSCLTPRLIVQHRRWPQRQALLDELGQILAETPPRAAFYPGAHARHAAVLAAHPEARLYGDGASESGRDSKGIPLPWALITDVDSSNADDICFKTESFCATLAETGLDARDTSEFLARATDFVNSTLWGTLTATLLVPDAVSADKQVGAALEQTVADLHYGTVCINLFSGLAYTMMNTPWGSFPGQEAWDIQSGMGFVNNPFMLRQPQKTIFRAPFKRIDPVTLRNRSIVAFGQQYADFQSQPSLSKLLRLFRVAMKG